MDGAMTTSGLSMRERARLDALYTRVRQGDHYEVLGLRGGASESEIQREYEVLRDFLRELLRPDRELGDLRVRAEVVSRAVENAWRIVGNPRERIRYDTQQAALTRPSEPPPRLGEVAANPSPTAPSMRNTAARSIADTMLSPHLLALLEAHLSTILGRAIDLRAVAGGALDLRDPTRALAAAEASERHGRWDEAAIWWHLAALAAPTDGALVLRAASALRRAGFSAAFEHYARVTQQHAVFHDGTGGVERG